MVSIRPPNLRHDRMVRLDKLINRSLSRLGEYRVPSKPSDPRFNRLCYRHDSLLAMRHRLQQRRRR